MFGTRLGPDEAYRFARGETVTSNTGLPARLSRPLDFLVVSDHAENLGLATAIAESNPELLKSPWGKMVHDYVKQGQGPKAYDAWMKGALTGTDPLKDLPGLARTMWTRATAAAEKYNEPGRFTALIGYEWSSTPYGNNLHRNVIFRDGKDKADQIVPLSSYDTVDPEKLWEWMAAYEKKTGGKVLAIPHNGNLSGGLMFDDMTLATKKPLDRDYAARRSRWEPLYEVTQTKGDSEAHPLLSPTDELANFERWDKATFGPKPTTPDMYPREYAREAYKRGLAYEQKLGANPFKFGIVGSTDSHTGLATPEEDNFIGKVAAVEPTSDPVRFDEVIVGRTAPKGNQLYARQISASGLAAVWARENTREALWDAMARKEVYATTGTRVIVRVFGGFDFTAKDLERSDFAEQGYARGVPMGGDLKAAPAGKAPAFVIRAVRDPDGANLDRIQVVKGWVDAEGKAHEKIYDVGVVRRAQAGQGRQAAAGRQHREREGSDVYERDRRALPHDLLAGPAVQPEGACVLLRPRAGDPDAALDHARRQVLRRRAAEGRAREHPGARIHVADLVHALARPGSDLDRDRAERVRRGPRPDPGRAAGVWPRAPRPPPGPAGFTIRRRCVAA